MPYSIAQAAAQLGVHPTTIRRQIRSGKLAAQLLDRQWFIQDDIIAHAMDQEGHSNENVSDGDSTAYLPLIAVLERQLEEKDRQIRELHLIVRSAHQQTQHMLGEGVSGRRRWWWSF